MTGWTEADPANPTTPHVGIAPGSNQAARLTSTGGATGETNEIFQRTATLGSEWTAECYFAVTDPDDYPGSNRSLGVLLHNGAAIQSYDYAVYMKINAGTGSAGQLNFYDSSWHIVGAGNEVTFSVDGNGDGDFSDAGDTLNVHRLRIVGHNWGTTGVNYDVLLSAANSTELITIATGLTYFQNYTPDGSNPSELTTIAFRTAWGMGEGQPAVIDNVSLEGEAVPGNIIIDESDPLEVYEEGETQSSFTVALSSPPGVDDVIVHLADDSDPNVVLVNPEELTFTQYDYNQPKTVLVKAIDDNLLNAAVGAVYYSTTLTTTAVSDSLAYAEAAPKHVYVRVYDDECGAIGYNAMDFDGDCSVDVADFSMFAVEWLSAEADNEMDVNDDCQVNIKDFATFADNFMATDRRVIRNQSGWPTIFGLNKDESFCVRRVVGNKTVTRTVKLISVTEYWEPDYWIANNPSHQTLRLAEVVVDVSGEQATLPARPYQMPMVVNGLRLYVEATQKWAHECNLASIGDMDSDVRFSVVAEGEGWGPTDMRFPIQDYRWRSSSYNNTWASLVPYNLLYYHRGEDFGAIPERLPVMAVMDGIITSTPLPGGAYLSNGIIVATASGLKFRCSHMNIETFDPGLTEGTGVEAGQMLAKTGMTWNGYHSQYNDPHLHIGFHFGGTKISTYPFLVEAYLRDYDDDVLAVAGGYHFGVPDTTTIELDATRSVPRPGREIVGYEWHLHDGRTLYQPTVQLTYDEPGLYSEELIVHLDNGAQGRDFAQVRIYDPPRGSNIASGWIHYSPVRGIIAGTEVLFWNRLRNTVGAVTINFGDGTPTQTIGSETVHAYQQSGIYTVTLEATGPESEPATVKTYVVVE